MERGALTSLHEVFGRHLRLAWGGGPDRANAGEPARQRIRPPRGRSPRRALARRSQHPPALYGNSTQPDRCSAGSAGAAARALRSTARSRTA